MDIFYILSKVFTFFLAPEIWIALLLIWRVFAKLRSTKKRLLIAALAIFFVFSNEALYKISVNAWQPSPVTLTNKTYDAGILLGGFVGFDASSKGYLREDADRFYQACKLYYAGTIRKIIVSGGTVSRGMPEEADYVKSEMISLGIQPGDIITETRSKTTFENAKFSKVIIDSLHITTPCVLITSATHMRRAARLFSKAGLHVVPYPSAYGVIENENLTLLDWLIPKVRILGNWQRLIKEIFGVAIYHVFNKA